MRSAECGVRSAECGVRSAECGVCSLMAMRTWAELMRERLAADATEAAEYLRATYEENDPQMMAHAVRCVQEACGSLVGLSL